MLKHDSVLNCMLIKHICWVHSIWTFSMSKVTAYYSLKFKLELNKLSIKN